MNLRKVAIGDRDVQKKYRVSTNSIVSYWRDEFDGDGHTATMAYGKQKPRPNMGTSKKEYKVSTGYHVNSLKCEVHGG